LNPEAATSGLPSNHCEYFHIGPEEAHTVARRKEPTDGKLYYLVCGQGRLEAFVLSVKPKFQAIVKEASKDDCFLMSLVENIARRQHSPLEATGERSKI